LANVSHVQRKQGLGWGGLDDYVLGQFLTSPSLIKDYTKHPQSFLNYHLKELGERGRVRLKWKFLRIEEVNPPPMFHSGLSFGRVIDETENKCLWV
jgi:hypothetical protein